MKRYLWVFAGFLFHASFGFALDDSFSVQMSSTSLASLQLGPNLTGIGPHVSKLNIYTQKPFASPAAEPILGAFAGRLTPPHEDVSIRLPLTISSTSAETTFSYDAIDRAVSAWEHLYEGLSALKSLKPAFVRLELDAEGLLSEWRLKRKFEYVMLFPVTYYWPKNELQDRNMDLRAMGKFIAKIEADTRGKLILQNNQSGRPAVLTFPLKDGSVSFQMHHPMHNVIFTPATKSWEYAYLGPVDLFKKLPEVKRALANSEVKQFVGADVAAVRVGAKGNPKNYFDLSFVKESGEKLAVRVDRKKVTRLTK